MIASVLTALGFVRRWWKAFAIGAVIVGVKILLVLSKRDGRQEAEAKMWLEALEDVAVRTEQGRDAVRKGRERGTPADRLRNNDGRW